jgi:broad specificity phosphatase PhoE
MPGLRIVLARHGRPDRPPDFERTISGHDIGRWYRRYDGFGIVAGVEAPAVLREAAASAGCVVASDARRAIETAARLSPGNRVHIEPVLREVGFPESLGVPFRLPAEACVLIARALQLLRWCDCDEPVSATRERAAIAAETLSRLAREHETLVVIGHGWFNGFIASELRRLGWRGPRWPPRSYWASAIYEHHLEGDSVDE